VTVCPFCKAPVAHSSGPCPRCGRHASEHPSIASSAGRTLSTDFDDDEPAGGLDLEKGSAVGSLGGMSSYESGGTSFDADLFGDEGGAIELDVPAPSPSGPAAPPPAPPAQGGVPDLAFDRLPSRPATPAAQPQPAPRPSEPSLPRPAAPAPPSSTRAVSVDAEPPAPAPAAEPAAPPAPARPSPAALVARYPAPPAQIWQAPIYAAQVLLRQLELRRDLTSLRRRRSPDVPLYEAALKAHDARTFAIGLAMSIAALTLASIIFFSPVILRFVRAPD
jgi:hypothetical protein